MEARQKKNPAEKVAKSVKRELFDRWLNSQVLVKWMEAFFFRYGRFVATRPYLVTSIALLICGALGVGLVRNTSEGNPYKLWVPQESDFIRNTDWLWRNFPREYRFHSVIVTAENVLTPEVLRLMLRIHGNVNKTVARDKSTWKDMCYRIPVINMDLAKKPPTTSKPNASPLVSLFASANISTNETRETSKVQFKRSLFTAGVDPSVDLYSLGYCDFVQQVTEQTCLETSLLELFASDDYGPETSKALENLTEEDILRIINSATVSEVFRLPTDFEKYLGGIERNSSGHIVGAKATVMSFYGRVNTSAITEQDRRDGKKGQPVDAGTLNFETALLESLLDPSLNNDTGITISVNVARSFDDLAGKSIQSDAFLFGAGFAIVFLYVQLMLGKFNCVEQRPTLSMVGIGLIALTILVTYGVCAAVGLVFSPMHNIIPFLLLGIGIDDMFVIVQSLDNLLLIESNKSLPIEDKIGLTMKHAGVSVTITSLTDVAVFAVGASTVLPALCSFCIYCAVGIFVVFLLQTSVFVAALAKDLERIEARRNSVFLCIKHEEEWQPSKCSKVNVMAKVFEWAAGWMCRPMVKVLIIVITLVLAGVGAWGLSMLKQEFNPVWFIPSDSYLKKWFKANSDYFPSNGEQVTINIGDIDYPSELWKIDMLIKKLRKETDVVTNVDSWFTGFHDYLVNNSLSQEPISAFSSNSSEFHSRLTQFLFSPDGAKHRHDFRFEGELECGKPAPRVMLSTIEFSHRLFLGPSEHIPAMNSVKHLVSSMNFSSTAFPEATEYASWETDEVIAQQTIRNLVLSNVCVFVATLLLLSSLNASVCVMTCVLLTLVDVAGFMHFWGLTIDVISCVNLDIAGGLCVDYAAHVAHSFMVANGSRNARVVNALRDIGPAVLSGGVSTFLAFVLTASSESHVFTTFFKIFFLVVTFGLFHGLVFLPVVLSLLGPPSYSGEEKEEKEKEEKGLDNQKAEKSDVSPVKVLSVRYLEDN